MDLYTTDVVFGRVGGRILILIFLIFVGLLIFFAFLIFISHKMTRPERTTGDWTPDDLGLEYEKVSFETEDGITLKGWWMDKDTGKTIICLHGYTASRWYEVYMRPLLEILKDEEYNILYFDFRAHGESGGKRTTIGNKELLDLKAAIDWLEEKGKSEKIGLIGYSMGAMVGIKGLASDKRIDCGIVDSPPLDLDSTSARSLKYFAGLPPFLYKFVKPMAKTIFDINTEDMFRFADKIDKPMLLIGGKNDPIMDISEMRRFFKKSDDCVEMWSTEAEHIRSIQVKKDEYSEKITSFFKNNL